MKMKPNEFPMTPVENSSQILAYGYDEATRRLAVEFHGGSLYHYADVPPKVWEEFQAAESKGTFLGRRIKGSFDYRRIQREPLDEDPASDSDGGVPE